MGSILSMKVANQDKLHANLELTQNEALSLKGNMENIHIFSENIFENTTRLVQRGKRESTKYFLLPRDFRKGVIPRDDVKCLRIETKHKNLFVFKVNKI